MDSQCPAVATKENRHLASTASPASGRVSCRKSGRSRPHIERLVNGSYLIFLAFTHWLSPDSRVLLLDPTYGEYSHVLERVIGCQVTRLTLAREDGYRLDVDRPLDCSG